MFQTKRKASQNHRTPVLQRRQLLAATAMLSVAPAILSACGTSKSPSPPATPVGSRRTLGALEVSPIGLGCQWRPSDEQDSVQDFFSSTIRRSTAVALIRKALEQGITLIDTAEFYGPFISEQVVGEALQGIRDEVVLASKFGFNVDLATGEAGEGLNSRPEHIKRSVEGILQRLGTDRVDLLYQHRVDPAVPIEDVVGAIKDLIREGKVLNYGLSEPGIQTIRRAHAEHPVTAIQNEYSMLYRGPEADVLPVCEELGIGFVCWSPLGQGFLSGSIDADTRFSEGPPPDFRLAVPRFGPEALPANMELIRLVSNWAKRKRATPAQLALAWLLAQKPWIVPIPGTTKIAHMEENLAAAAITFTGAELSELNTALAAVQIQGERLPPDVLMMSGVEAPPKP